MERESGGGGGGDREGKSSEKLRRGKRVKMHGHTGGR